MATRIAINGFGRIGRQVFKALHEEYDDIEVVAVNDLVDPHTNAHLLKYDSTYGIYDADVEYDGDSLLVNGREIKVFAERVPANLPWGNLGVDIVIESTGFFTDATKAQGHRDAGAKKVIISAPAKNEDITIVMGVNDDLYDPAKHHVVSNGSCTTNCLAPVAKVMLDTFGIVNAFMTTIHSYTNDQNLLDLPHRKGDLRRARAAAVNMVPTSTGAAKAIAEVIPALKGKCHGTAMRVPTVDVSVVDLTVITEKPVTVESINSAMKAAAESGRLKGVLQYVEEELVSCDFIGNPYSSCFDSTQTLTMGDNFAKIFSWYDNEWGFSCRMIDLMRLMAKKG
ncbi:MAG TPA: type I glyceraldehyde-3-phosphate dehydrogenase [Chloroflexi bacterium]|nr:type I glyceraldehyde-3-phosphate dehydrogenase [Chloroflexota bacterium]